GSPCGEPGLAACGRSTCGERADGSGAARGRVEERGGPSGLGPRDALAGRPEVGPRAGGRSPARPREGRPVIALDGLAREDVRAARLAWASRIIDEQRSVVVFSELLCLLAEAQAPLEALATVERLIADEARHVSLCAGVVEW